MKNIKLIEVPSEIGAGTRGASLGIDAIKIAALDFMSNFFIHFPSEKVDTENRLLFEPIQSPFAKRIQGVATMYDRIGKAVSETIKNNFFPVILSGDHSNAGGTITGIKMAKPKSKLGVIWIDAHADLHTPYTTPSGNMHGMPLATAIGEDNIDYKVHEPDDTTKKLWNQLKGTGKNIPKTRLEAIPWARFTVEAQAQLERDGALRQRRLGALGTVDMVGGGESEEAASAELGRGHAGESEQAADWSEWQTATHWPYSIPSGAIPS